jgi:hypothetical protein
MDPEAVKSSLLDDNDWKAPPGSRARAFLLSSAKRASMPATSPAATACLDIFSPPPGDSDVISHFDWLNSNETKIASRSVRIVVGASDR